jgi:hypothetical protein
VSEERQRESLSDETRSAIDESRMVLPGVQALFGFQLIAIFNETFQKISQGARMTHLVSLLLVAVVIVCVMAPAAFHRIAERGWVSRRLINLTSNFLTVGMAVLMFALSIEVGLVVAIVLGSTPLGTVIGSTLFIILGVCWFLLPVRHRRLYRPHDS